MTYSALTIVSRYYSSKSEPAGVFISAFSIFLIVGEPAAARTGWKRNDDGCSREIALSRNGTLVRTRCLVRTEESFARTSCSRANFFTFFTFAKNSAISRWFTFVWLVYHFGVVSAILAWNKFYKIQSWSRSFELAFLFFKKMLISSLWSWLKFILAQGLFWYRDGANNFNFIFSW